MALDRKTLELVAVGAAVAANCGPCLRRHAREAQESGASGEEIVQAIAAGRAVRAGAAAILDRAAAARLGAAPPPAAGAPCGCASATGEPA